MNCDNHELSARLHDAYMVEISLIDRLREVCAASSPHWIDDADERVRRIEVMSELVQTLKQAQQHSEPLFAAWREARLSTPLHLSEASEARRAALVTALACVQFAQQRAATSKEEIVSLLAQTNQMQQMLGAYHRR